jgi:hypothetical protein
MLDFEDMLADELGFLDIVTPGQISDYRNSVAISADTLNSDFQRTANIDPYILEAWNAWYDGFTDYFTEQSWWGDTWGGAMTAVERKAKELADWRDIYKAESGKPATGAAITTSASKKSELDILTLAKWIAIPVLAYFAWDLLRKRL